MISSQISAMSRKNFFPKFSRIISTSAKIHCKDRKDVPPIIKPPTQREEIVPIAPKVIAKNPPVEEMTRGRKFDPNTQSYKTVKVSGSAAVKSVPAQLADAQVVDVTNKKGRQQETITNPPREADAARNAFTASAHPGGNVTVTGGGGNTGPPSGDNTPVPRLTRAEPERTMFCLIPYPWVKAFNNKTGVTGFWTFLFTYSTYLFSKEKIIMEHDFYGGLSVVVLCWLLVKYVGPSVAQYLDKGIDSYESSFQQNRIDEKETIEAAIQHELTLQISMEEQLVLVAAKRENVDLQLEAEFRARQMEVYKTVKNMLDYHVAYETVERRYAQEQMVRWTLEKAHASITEELDYQFIEGRLIELDALLQQRQAI